jgi:hypothetical protein
MLRVGVARFGERRGDNARFVIVALKQQFEGARGAIVLRKSGGRNSHNE